MNLVEKNACCGCSACHDICAHNAITMEMGRGFLYPHINEEKCRDCGLCASVCPVLTHAENDASDDNDFEPTAWAAWNTNDEQRAEGASGGLFEAFANHMLHYGGFVCGCAFSEDFKGSHHIIIEKMEELERVAHSKYIQSEMQNVYTEIRSLLDAGRKGLFCGTPCQVAALYNSLRAEERERLLLVDVFCKGVPSPLAHAKYLSYLEEREHSKITNYHSKNKEQGWGKFFTRVEYANGKKSYIRSALDSLFVTRALNVRPSCANCRYKGLDRVSDVSIGDYWGITGIPESEVKRGVSAVVVNTVRGAKLLDELAESGYVKTEMRSIFDASNAKNPGYSQKIVLGNEYEQFFEDLEALSMPKLLKKYAQNNSKLAIASRKMQWIWSKFRGISIPKFIYLNFLSKHVERGKGAYIIPGSHAIFEFSKGSKLIVEHGINLVNFRKPRGSKVESWIQLNGNAKMIIHKEVDIRNSRFVVQNGAILEIGDLEMNGLCNVVVRKKVTIGYDVMIARNVNIYDSDYHPFSIGDDIAQVVSKPVTIENHVWIGNGASITKGVTIGEGAVISTESVVVRNVKARTMVAGNPAKEMCRDIYWSKGRRV